MGWGKGYGNYRSDEQREGPVCIFRISSFFLRVFVCVFLGVFWGGIRYTLHVFLRDDDERMRML